MRSQNKNNTTQKEKTTMTTTQPIQESQKIVEEIERWCDYDPSEDEEMCFNCHCIECPSHALHREG